MSATQETTKPEPVAVRRWPAKEGGGLILIFPYMADSHKFWECEMWEQVGGHGTGDVGIVTRTKPVSDDEARAAVEEYARLYGQDPAVFRLVRKVNTRAAQEARRRQIAVWKA